jgi:hypothetical protein
MPNRSATCALQATVGQLAEMNATLRAVNGDRDVATTARLLRWTHDLANFDDDAGQPDAQRVNVWRGMAG